MSLQLSPRWQYNAQRGVDDQMLQVDAAIEQALQLKRLADALLRQLHQGKYSNAVGSAASIGALGHNIAVRVEVAKAFLSGLSQVAEGSNLPPPSYKDRSEDR